MKGAEKLSPNSAHYLPSDPDDKGQFGFSWHIVVSHFASSTAHADFTPVHLPVLLVVLLSPLVDKFPGHFTCLVESDTKNAEPGDRLKRTLIEFYI